MTVFASNTDPANAGTVTVRLASDATKKVDLTIAAAATAWTRYTGTMTGDPSQTRDTFEFIKGQAGGTELIKGLFDAADVRIDLDGYSSKEVKAAIAGQTTSGGSVTLSLSDGTKVTFENIAALTSKNFV